MNLKIEDLHKLISDKKIKELEKSLNQFNVFEVLGIQTREIKHSNFFAWLLNPNGNHGFGDYFLRKFLIHVLNVKEHRITTLENIDDFDFSQIEVTREDDNMDLLLDDPLNQFACIIENKVFSGEGENQLSKYRKRVEHQFHYYQHKLYVFLTPDGHSSTENGEDDYYVPVSYEIIYDIIDDILLNKILSIEVEIFLKHYQTLVRRHIVGDKEMQALAQSIYKEHKDVLEYIFKNRLDFQSEMKDFLINLVSQYDVFELDYSVKNFVRFIYSDFDLYDDLKHCEKWTKSNRMLLFEFENYENSLKLNLVLGPGPDTIRRKIFDCANSNQIFNVGKRSRIENDYPKIYTKDILSKGDYIAYQKTQDDTTLKNKVKQKFREFIEKDMVLIADSIKGIGLR